MKDEKNILVVRLSSLGDVLMTLPAVKAIKNLYPGSHISWLIEGSISDLLSYQGFIDKVIRFPRTGLVQKIKHGNISGSMTIARSFLNDLRALEYDLIIDFHGIIKSIILSRCARGKRLIGFDKIYAKESSHLFYDERIPGRDRRLHKVERNMLMATYLGAGAQEAPDIDLTVPIRYQEYIDIFFREKGISENVIAVNPFSSPGSEFKRWGISRYKGLIKRLRAQLGADIVILWGPGEKEEARSLIDESDNGVFLSCPTDIPQLFALLKRVRLYISGDTGVMHLAAAAKIPVVAIFGPTDHRINAPYGMHSSIVRKDIYCSPCKTKDCPDRGCLEEISIDEVFYAAKEMYYRTR